MQKIISERILKARKERKLTQKELARLVGKQATNISDIETGRVQVSAVDLYAIAQALGKPIEYFYGVISENSEVEDVVFALRQQSPEAQQKSVQIMKAWNTMHALLQKINADNRKPTTGEMQQFLSDFVAFLVQIDASHKAAQQFQKEYRQFLAEQGFDLDALLSSPE